jgi:hypothetical protein
LCFFSAQVMSQADTVWGIFMGFVGGVVVGAAATWYLYERVALYPSGHSTLLCRCEWCRNSAAVAADWRSSFAAYR